jgi:hypothetical protein
MPGALQKCADKFIETTIDDETVIMDLDSGSFFSLSGTALDIWGLIDGSRDREGILAQLSGDYGAEPSEIAADVDGFLAELDRSGLIAAQGEGD